MARQTGTNDDFLAMALIGYEAQIARINTAIAEIRAKLGHRGPGRSRAVGHGAAPARRTIDENEVLQLAEEAGYIAMHLSQECENLRSLLVTLRASG